MTYNPAEIIPFLKKRVLEMLNELDTNEFKEGILIETLDTLSCITKYAPSIVVPHLDSICGIFNELLYDHNLNSIVYPHILAALSSLSYVGKSALLPYIKNFFPIIIQNMQDMSISMKRESSINTLSRLIKDTGYVILPFYEYLQLLEHILDLLRNESGSEIRKAILRLIGGLGAIDSFLYKRIQLRFTDKTRLSLVEMLRLDFKQPLKVENILTMNFNASTHLNKLLDFYNELTVVNEIDKSRSLSLMKLPDLRKAFNREVIAIEKN